MAELQHFQTSQRLDIVLFFFSLWVTGNSFGCNEGVLTMTYSHITREIRQMLLSSDNLGAETVALPGVYLASLSARCNSTGILSPVLEDWKPVVDVLDGRSSGVGEDDGDDSTHFRDSLPPSQTKQDQQTVDLREDISEERGVKVMLAH